MDYVSRADWEARSPRYAYTRQVGSEGIIVHHLGDGVHRDQLSTDYAALMRQTQNFHMGPSRGWNDFAYGWGVGGGQVYEARGWGNIDGADTGKGKLMHSVLWLGDSTVNEVPQEDLRCINEVIAEHDRRFGHSYIGGHRDINATGCPGDNLAAWLSAGRPVKGSTKRPLIPPPPPPTPALERSMESFVWKDRHTQYFWLADDLRILTTWSGGPTGHFSPPEEVPGNGRGQRLAVEHFGDPTSASGTTPMLTVWGTDGQLYSNIFQADSWTWTGWQLRNAWQDAWRG